MKKLTLIAAVAFAISCQNTPAEKPAEISALEKSNPKSVEYKTELAKLINDHPEDYEVTFNHYHEIKNGRYLNVTIDGNGFTGTEDILLKDENPTAITDHKGKGYGGAQLEDLKVSVENTPDGEILIFKSVANIND